MGIPAEGVVVERADRIGRAAAYGAAAALVPYLVIKVSWVVGSLLGLLPVGRGFGLGGWLVLNTVTIAMAAAGITLGLALVRPLTGAGIIRTLARDARDR
ncbi:hypothetical protein [Streptomyces sp. NPDC102462]|uniref:hypothetical protein n=1 Tax=Streptomyces sp. NPDC102462 TaxID=3366178 RepID=UPI00380EC6E1